MRTSALKARLEELERRKTEIERSLQQTPEPQPLLHPKLAEVYRREVEALRDALHDPATGDEALEFMRGLIESVVMRPKPDGYEIELVGEIANMVALAADSRAGKSG